MSLDSCLILCKNPVRFEPVTAVNSVFFDEANRQIFTVRSGGATGVTVKGPDDKTCHTFQLDDKGSLISIKFSHRNEILALQRSDTAIEFVNVVDGKLEQSKYSQSSKGQNSKILTFHWINVNDVIFITTNGVEFYQINQMKRQVKLHKSYNLSVAWSIFSQESAVLLCCTTLKGRVICPFYFKDGQVLKSPTFSVCSHSQSKSGQSTELFERDVTIVNLYGDSYIAVLQHLPLPSETGTEVDLFMLNRETPAKKTYTLVTGVAGRFAINVVDNLVIIHHQASKSSIIFDIRLHGESRNSVMYIYPLVEPLPIRSQKILLSAFSLRQPKSEVECQLYSPTWIVFQPNIITDAALGCMWFLQLKLDAFPALFKDSGRLLDFLLQRHGSKAIILKVLKKMLSPERGQSSYKELRDLFDKLNGVYKMYIDAEQVYLRARKQEAYPGTTASSMPSPYPPHRTQVIVDESDMYTQVLSVLAKQTGVDHNHVCRVIVEYIRSLNDHRLTIQHYLYELIICALTSSNNFYQLEQYIHHNAVDSRATARYLLSLKPAYSQGHQIAVEMCKKNSMCNDDTVDVLLSKHKILEAMRLVKLLSMQDTISARKFLEAAKESKNDMLFYETYKFFEARNLRLRGTKDFAPGEQCDAFASYYVDVFSEQS